MKKYSSFGIAAAAALCMALTGCGGSGETAKTTAPAVEYAQLVDPALSVDQTGAEIEVLSFDHPIDFSYSSPEMDMIFTNQDGVWLDGMESSIPINQERFASMADVFLHLKAVSQIENPGALSEYGLDNEMYSVYMTDSEKGEANLLIGNQDANGNYYMTREGHSGVYTLKPETVGALIFDYDTLVIRDTLDITVTAEDMVSASATKLKKTTVFDESAMERIAAGISAFKPSEYSSFAVTAQELASAELSEDACTDFVAEFQVDGETRSLTVHIGGYANADETLRYVMLDGSDMIAMVDRAAVDDMLNGMEEEAE